MVGLCRPMERTAQALVADGVLIKRHEGHNNYFINQPLVAVFVDGVRADG